MRYGVMVAWSGMPDNAWDEARHEGIRKACGYLDAAIYELKLSIGDDTEPLDIRAYDPELWEHVKGLVQDEDWGKVASQTAIFVENHVREWAGNPTDKKGEPLYSNVLWQTVLADDSEFRLGQRSAEWQGWRSLGIGFSLALRNVDVHRIQRRDDAKRYAIGVLGLGSLLLTQLRYEHSEILNEE
ncbi:TIGR02391 family protein [Kribbella sp. NPDC026596]|uniref:TIGR02391 family protein n=1 Tax=Kribbella sp. NPDC026596 TaxID=3155122 RepID=UPI0033C529D9